MLEIKELTKRYGHRPAVENVSFSAGKGEILGFLGQNGAGKSTTMNIITGYISATSGSVSVNGLRLEDSPREYRRQIGYLPEIPPLYPEMTVGEYLSFVCEIKDVKPGRIKGHVEELCEMLQLADHRGRLIRNLSKGYRQRVGLAQALAGDPEILLLDEPTAGLDPRQIHEIQELIRYLGKEHTVILSSHILSEVAGVCSRAVILHHGKILAEDSLSHLTGPQQGFCLRVGCAPQEARQILTRIPGLTALEQLPAAEPSACDFCVTADPQTDIRREASLRLAQAGYPILMLKPVHSSLEETFLRLTSDEEENSHDLYMEKRD